MEHGHDHRGGPSQAVAHRDGSRASNEHAGRVATGRRVACWLSGDDQGRTKLLGLLEAGDPRGEVRTAWHAKETVRGIYAIEDPDVAVEFVARLGVDLQDQDCPPEVRQLGRTIVRWADQISAWHRAHVSNGPTEANNNLIKRVKRVAFGFRRFASYRTRALLYAGQLNWDPLATVKPRRNAKRH